MDVVCHASCRSTGPARGNCIHGLGWAGAERYGREFVPEGEKVSEKKDPRLLGIAYNLKRFDPAAGVEPCGTVQRPDLKDKCLAPDPLSTVLGAQDSERGPAHRHEFDLAVVACCAVKRTFPTRLHGAVSWRGRRRCCRPLLERLVQVGDEDVVAAQNLADPARQPSTYRPSAPTSIVTRRRRCFRGSGEA